MRATEYVACRRTVTFHSYQLQPDAEVDFDGTHDEYLATYVGMTLKQAAAFTQHITNIQAQAYVIQGVPFFVIDGQYGMSGAQPDEAFENVLRDLWSERSAETQPAAG